jgi:hypothetical protein
MSSGPDACAFRKQMETAMMESKRTRGFFINTNQQWNVVRRGT